MPAIGIRVRMMCMVDGGQGDDSNAGLLGDDSEFQGCFGDDAERVLGADEETHEAVACGGFAGTTAHFDDPPIGEHDGEVQHPFFHRAVAHRIGAAAACASHSADFGGWAGADGEEETSVFD